MNDEAVYRTAPATPGLLTRLSHIVVHIIFICRIKYLALKPGPLPRLVEATTEELHPRPQGHCSQLSPQLPLAGPSPGLDGWMDGCMDGPTQSQLQIFTNFTHIVCLCDTSSQGPGGEHTAEEGATPQLHPRHQDLRGQPSFFPAKLVSPLICSLVLHLVDLLE